MAPLLLRAAFEGTQGTFVPRPLLPAGQMALPYQRTDLALHAFQVTSRYN